MNSLFLRRSSGYFFNVDKSAMTSKGAKETIVTRLGFKSSSSASKAEAELEKVRKENAHLRRKIDELAKRHIKPPDSDKSKLLEVNKVVCLSVAFRKFRVKLRISCIHNCVFLLLMRIPDLVFCFFFPQRILSLETLRERNNQQLLVKEQELETLRQQLTARGGEVCTHVSSLQKDTL